ncbi:MAG: efflux transporter outer membrane subunit, partial [Chlamydiales bacterium]|nr:efflux transporter outer membrane subunit [Chlamydiales bacterium]
ELALHNNPSLKSAESKYRAAYQQALVVRSKLFPTLDAGFSDQAEKWSKNGNLVIPGVPLTNNLINNLGLNFNYEFDFWGKNRKAYEAMLGRANAELAEKKQADLIVSTTLATQYFALLAAKWNIQLLSDVMLEQESLVQLIKKRIKNRVDNEMQLFQAEIALNNTKEQLEIAYADEKIATTAINVLMGKGPEEKLCIELNGNNTLKPLALPNQIGLDLLARRPDLSAQIWLIDAASKEIGVARTLFYPDVNLFANAGFQSFHFNNLFAASSFTWTINPTVNLPLFTGGRLKANLSNKLFFFEQEVYKYNNLLLEAAKEVSDQITKFKQTYRNTEIREQVVEESISIYNLHLSRFNHGLDSYLTVIDKNIELNREKINLVNMQFSHQMQTILLIKALGGGFYQPIDITIEANHGR